MSMAESTRKDWWSEDLDMGLLLNVGMAQENGSIRVRQFPMQPHAFWCQNNLSHLSVTY